MSTNTVQPLKVAYVLLYFPKLTETFIADEIASVQSGTGIEVQIVSLLPAPPGPVQPVSQHLMRYTSNASPLFSKPMWRAHLHFSRKSFLLYMRLLTTLVKQPYNDKPLRTLLKRVVIFLKAVSTAYSLRDSEIDLFHAHFAWLPGAATWICARLLHRPFTVTVHAYDVYSRKNDLLRLVTREASHVIAISEFNRSQILALGTGLADAISVIYCGVDLTRVAEVSQTRRSDSARDTVRLLSVGSLLPKKGHRILLDACRVLRERGVNFSCTIIGAGPDERDLVYRIREYELGQHVTLIGALLQPDVAAAYRHHDIFVLASLVAPDGDRDGIPVALMEAGNAGLPLVSTSLSGVPELVRHGETGWLVPPNDPTALADALATLAADPILRARLGEGARRLVRSQFSIHRSALELAALFRATCKEWDRRDASAQLE